MNNDFSKMQPRQFDRETLQRLTQVLNHMHLEVHTAPAVFNDDPGDLHLNIFGQRDLRVEIKPGRKGGMSLRLIGLGQTQAITVFPTKDPGAFVPSIVKAAAGLMARAYAVELHNTAMQEQIDAAE